jgi:hypothetical protein
MNREQIKARLDRPLSLLDFFVGFGFGVILMIASLAFVTRAEAAPAASGITCWTKNVTTVQNTARVTIKSTKKIVYGQTSVKFSYFDANMRQQWITRDAGYGAVIYVVRPKGSREWGLFKTWHAGQPCSAYAVGGPAGMVSN